MPPGLNRIKDADTGKEASFFTNWKSKPSEENKCKSIIRQATQGFEELTNLTFGINF